jgi:hypothetical protein
MLTEEETKRCGGNTIINNINNVTTVVNTAPCVRQKLTAYDLLKRIHEHVLTSMQRQLVASKDRPVFLIPEPNDLFKLSYNISNIYISSLSTQKGQASELNRARSRWWPTSWWARSSSTRTPSSGPSTRTSCCPRCSR